MRSHYLNVREKGRTTMAEQKKLRIFELDPNLNAFEGDINDRVNRYKNKKKE